MIIHWYLNSCQFLFLYCFNKIVWVSQDQLDENEYQIVIKFIYNSLRRDTSLYGEECFIRHCETMKKCFIMWSHLSTGQFKKRLFINSQWTSYGGKGKEPVFEDRLFYNLELNVRRVSVYILINEHNCLQVEFLVCWHFSTYGNIRKIFWIYTTGMKNSFHEDGEVPTEVMNCFSSKRACLFTNTLL